MSRILEFTIIGLVTTVVTALGCDYCLLTQGISPLETSNGIGFRLDQRYTRLSTLFDNGEKIDREGALETHWTTQFSGFYTVKPRLSFIAVVPIVRRFGEGESHHHEEEEIEKPLTNHKFNTRSLDSFRGFVTLSGGGEGAAGSSFGLSDIALLGRYQFYKRHTLASTFIAVFQTGVRIPTGTTDARNDDGEVLEAHLQPGTGAFNFLLGASANYVKNNLGFAANGIYSIATEGKVGGDIYQYGNALNYDASLRYRLISSLQSGLNFFANLGIAGEYRRHEKQNGLALDDTGGHTFYLAPSVQVFYQQFVFELSYWHTVGHNLNGRQLGETFKTFAGLTFLLR